MVYVLVQAIDLVRKTTSPTIVIEGLEIFSFLTIETMVDSVPVTHALFTSLYPIQ